MRLNKNTILYFLAASGTTALMLACDETETASTGPTAPTGPQYTCTYAAQWTGPRPPDLQVATHCLAACGELRRGFREGARVNCEIVHGLVSPPRNWFGDGRYNTAGEVCRVCAELGFGESTNTDTDRTSSEPRQAWTMSDRCNDGKPIHYRFMEEENGRFVWFWPDANRVYVVDEFGEETTTINVRAVGDKICFGAETPDGRTYWGVGLDGDQRCDDCCYTARAGLQEIRRNLGC